MPTWDHPRELGSARALGSVGGAPISVLGGFTLTAAITAARVPCQTIWRDLATATLSAAVVCFLLGLIFISEAAPYIASPDERLSWHPEAKYDTNALEMLRRKQRQDEWMLDLYEKRKNWAITWGILFTLAGLAFLLLTTDDTWGVYFAAAAIGVAFTITLLSQLRRRARFFTQRLFPRLDDWPYKTRHLKPLSKTQRAALDFREPGKGKRRRSLAVIGAIAGYGAYRALKRCGKRSAQ
ncbi:hypothetical protein ACT1U9_04570 [Streptomyces sp. BR1]|uniref:hypothetical protein n=1 Tax=Streptomyces sp. BR1 TaxID=1592323 RepID=UPI00402B4D3F